MMEIPKKKKFNKTLFFEKLSSMWRPQLLKRYDDSSDYAHAYWILEDEEDFKNYLELPGVRLYEMDGTVTQDSLDKYNAREKAMEEKYQSWIDQYFGADVEL